jgi:hypothetical protein
VGRTTEGLRHPRGRRPDRRGRADRLPEDPHRPLQGARRHRVRRRTPADLHGETQKFELREKEWAGHTSRIQG